MNHEIKLWQASKTKLYFSISVAVLCFSLITIVLAVFGSSYLGSLYFLLLTLILFVLVTISGRMYANLDAVEKVINHHLKATKVWPFYEQKDVKVVFDSANLNQVVSVQYDGHIYFHDSPPYGGYKFGWEFYHPDFFLCRVSFKNSQKHDLIFVIERIDVTENIISVYQVP